MNSAETVERAIEFAARIELGDQVKIDLIVWAVDMLVQGNDSKSLRMLAARAESDLVDDVYKEFDLSLAELTLPPRAIGRQALEDYACYLCKKILKDQINLEKAHALLYEIWMRAHYDLRLEDRPFDIWMYLSDSLKLVEDGHHPLLAELEGLSTKTYHKILKCEASKFLDRHRGPSPNSPASISALL